MKSYAVTIALVVNEVRGAISAAPTLGRMVKGEPVNVTGTLVELVVITFVFWAAARLWRKYRA